MVAGADLMTGLIDKNAIIDTFRADSLVIERAADGPAHIDGEPIHIDNVMDIKCHHASLSIFTPEEHEHRPFYPIVTPMADAIKDMGLSIRHLFPSSFHSALHHGHKPHKK